MKKLMAVLVLVTSLFCLVPSAFAGTNWVEVCRDNTFLIYVDRGTLQYKNGKIIAREKWIYRNDTLRKFVSSNFKYKKLIGYSLKCQEYCVENRTKRFLSCIDCDKSGGVLGGFDTPASFTVDISSGTQTDKMFVCYKKILGIE